MLTATGKLSIFFFLPPPTPVILILSNPLLGTETGQKEGEGKDTKDERRRREGGESVTGTERMVGGEEGASFISLRYTQLHGATLTSISAPLAAASAGAALDRPDCVSAADLCLLHTR